MGGQVERARESGCDPVLIKLVLPEELLCEIKRILRLSATQRKSSRTLRHIAHHLERAPILPTARSAGDHALSRLAITTRRVAHIDAALGREIKERQRVAEGKAAQLLFYPLLRGFCSYCLSGAQGRDTFEILRMTAGIGVGQGPTTARQSR
jgi:hypothetical protein